MEPEKEKNLVPDLDILMTSMNTVSEGVVVVDKNLRMIYHNTAAKKFMQDVKAFEDMHVWYDHFVVRELRNNKILAFKDIPMMRALSGLRFMDTRISILNISTQEIVYLSCNGTPVISHDHEIVGAILAFRDITADFKADKMIKRQKAFYKNILDFIPAAIFVRDQEYNYVFSNQTFDRMRAERSTSWEPVTSENHRMVKEHDDQVIKSLSAIEFMEKFMTSAGEEKCFRTIRFPLYHQETDKVLVCGIAFDVTEELRMRENLEFERVRAFNAAKLASIGTLAGEIGHEINNPIAIIKSIIFVIREMMKDKELTDEVLLDKIDTIDQTLTRVSKIIKSLKNLSRQSNNEKMEICHLKTIFQDVISLSDLKFRKKGIALHYDRESPVLETSLECFQVQIGEVLMNLLSNAVDAVEYQKRPWVRVKLEEDQDSVLIKVSDSGKGVPEELREKIFEPFFTTKPISKGTGLGLSISKNIVKQHQGEIFIGPEENESCFIVRLPKVMKQDSPDA